MTICVLGGTGFLGSRLAARLTNAGLQLKIPTRSLARNRHLLVLPQVKLVQADVHDPATLRELLSGCDTAVNLVGILNEPGRRGAGFHRVHTELTGKLIDACRAAGVGKLVQISALKANAETGPSHYLRSKGEADDPAAFGDIRPGRFILEPVRGSATSDTGNLPPGAPG